MPNKSKKFPVYRKYANEKVFFKVISLDEFERIDIVGNGYSLHVFQANNYADKLFISDVIENEGGKWETSNEKEFEAKLQYCKKHLHNIDHH
jgi:hypothetical protein